MSSIRRSRQIALRHDLPEIALFQAAHFDQVAQNLLRLGGFDGVVIGVVFPHQFADQIEQA